MEVQVAFILWVNKGHFFPDECSKEWLFVLPYMVLFVGACECTCVLSVHVLAL
jgi:hypothetical protein